RRTSAVAVRRQAERRSGAYHRTHPKTSALEAQRPGQAACGHRFRHAQRPRPDDSQGAGDAEGKPIMNTATHHLIVQGPDVHEGLAQSLAVLCGARGVHALGENVFRLSQARQRPELIEVCRGWRIDYAFVPAGKRLDDFKLLAMDMDST